MVPPPPDGVSALIYYIMSGVNIFPQSFKNHRSCLRDVTNTVKLDGYLGRWPWPWPWWQSKNNVQTENDTIFLAATAMKIDDVRNRLVAVCQYHLAELAAIQQIVDADPVSV